MNSGGIQQCAWHSVHNQCYLVIGMDHIDDNATVDEADCISTQFGHSLCSAPNHVVDVNLFISELQLLPIPKISRLSNGWYSPSELPLRFVSWR